MSAAKNAARANAQLADALCGAMTAAGFDGDPQWKDDNDATWWFCRKALWDYADERGDGWEPHCTDDRHDPPPSVAYEIRLHEAGRSSLGWVSVDARAAFSAALPETDGC